MEFLNQKLEIFEKGKFERIDRNFITEAMQATQSIMEIQEKYNKKDNDSIFNELKDGVIGIYLGFELINIEKHGLDGKKDYIDEYLEVKQVSFHSKTWSATFNDTTIDKANAFKDIKTTLAVGVWDKISDLLFIVYGKSADIGYYLEEKVNECKKESRRSTQTIGIKQLVCNYGFKIKAIKDKNYITRLFRLKYPQKDWWSDKIE